MEIFSNEVAYTPHNSRFSAKQGKVMIEFFGVKT